MKREDDFFKYDKYSMQDPSGSIGEVTEITIYGYIAAENENTDHAWNFSFYDGSEWSTRKGSNAADDGKEYAWRSETWTDLSISADDIKDLQVELGLRGDYNAWTWVYYWTRCAALYAEITYTEPPAWDGGRVNSVDHSNIAKVNSVDIENINKISGV